MVFICRAIPSMIFPPDLLGFYIFRIVSAKVKDMQACKKCNLKI